MVRPTVIITARLAPVPAAVTHRSAVLETHDVVKACDGPNRADGDRFVVAKLEPCSVTLTPLHVGKFGTSGFQETIGESYENTSRHVPIDALTTTAAASPSVPPPMFGARQAREVDVVQLAVRHGPCGFIVADGVKSDGAKLKPNSVSEATVEGVLRGLVDVSAGESYVSPNMRPVPGTLATVSCRANPCAE